MRNTRIGVWAVVSVTLLLLAAEAVRKFKPPTVAVVEVARVVGLYDKRKDRKAELDAETKLVEDKLKELEKTYKELVAEIPNLEPGQRKNDLLLQKMKLEMDVKDLKEKELKRLRDTYVKYLDEIKADVAQEIEDYAKAQDLDLVIEKTVVAESEEIGAGFRGPIVHFVKPEIDITQEVAERLNRRYRKP